LEIRTKDRLGHACELTGDIWLSMMVGFVTCAHVEDSFSMYKTVFRSMFLVGLAAATLSCFRETGVEIPTVTSTQFTPANQETLSRGTDAASRIGDYILGNAELQVVLHGDRGSHKRDLFMSGSYGSIIDVSTQFEKFGSRDLVPRNDDGFNQVSQGVNMDLKTPIAYDRIEVTQVDATNASLTIYGRVHDPEGILASQGAAVGADGRVLGCEVVTTIELSDLPEGSGETTDDGGIITGRPINYLTMTTVITNNGSQDLPIRTVNDMAFVGIETYNTFVPYPEWGFNYVEDSDAYANYVHLQPVQRYTTQYGFYSRIEEILNIRRKRVEKSNSEVIFVGKATGARQSLAAGEQITYIRQIMAMNGGNDAVVTSYNSQTAYRDLVQEMVENTSPNNSYRNMGFFGVTIFTNNARDGKITFSYIHSEEAPVTYYNGTQYVPLEEDRTFPIWGDSTLRNEGGSRIVQAFVPVGQLRFDVEVPNSPPFGADHRLVNRLDDDNNVILDENGEPIQDPVDFVLSPIDLAELGTANATGLGNHILPVLHANRNMVSFDLQDREIMSRTIFERHDGEPVVIGEYPVRNQGNIGYLDLTSPVTFWFPEGNYDQLVSRGPLNNVNILPLEIINPADATEENPGQSVQLVITLGQALELNGYLSADFDVRSSADPQGHIFEGSLLYWAYAEDLDVAFFPNANSRPILRSFYMATARGLGSFSADDEENDVDSFFDELAFSRATATIGRVAGSYPDRGRFALLNVPDEEVMPDFEVPLMETDPAELYDRIREKSADIVIHVTRPRAPEGLDTGLFTVIAKLSNLAENQPIPADNAYFNATAATGSDTNWLDFDLLQLLAGNRYDEYLLARADWFNLLNAGIFKPVTGGSSQAQTKDLPIGAVRTYVSVVNTALRDNDLAEFWTNARAGNMFVTNGPLIEADIGGVTYGGTANASGGKVTVHTQVRSAPWIPVRELRYIIDGQVVQAKALNLNSKATVRFEETVELVLPAGSGPHWIVIEAGAKLSELEAGTGLSGTFGRVYPGHLPLAFTNPIFINN